MPRYFVYVDESGDPGLGRGSSRYITLGALVTPHPRRIEKIPLIIRKRRLKKSLARKPELKFHNSSPGIRNAVLVIVASLEDVRILSLSVNKMNAPPRLIERPERFYDLVCGTLISDVVRFHGTEALYHAVFDARPHNRPPSYDFRHGIGDAVERELRGTGFSMAQLDVSVLDSRNSKGLQVADFVVGAIHRRRERGDRSYRDIIAPVIASDKVLF